MLNLTQDMGQGQGLSKDQYYEAIVVQNNDSKYHMDGKMCARIQARIPVMFDGIEDDDLPWAIPDNNNCDGASSHSGWFDVPKVGTKVQLRFQMGNPLFPVWTPFHITEDTMLPEAKTHYPNRKVLRCQNRAMVIIDTENNEMMIRNPGTLKVYIEGNVEMHVHGNVDEHVDGNVRRKIDGNLDEHVVGNYTRQIDGSLNENVTGNRHYHAGGSQKVDVGGESVYYSAGQTTVEAGGMLVLEGSAIHENSGMGAGSPGSAAAANDPQFTDWIGVPGGEVGEGFSSAATKADIHVIDNEGNTKPPTAAEKQAMKEAGLDPDASANHTASKEDHNTPEAKKAVPQDCSAFETMKEFPTSLHLTSAFTLGDLSVNAILQRAQVVAQEGLTVPQLVCNLKQLAMNALDPISQKFGRPIITSAFRPSTGKSSWHTKGSAADIQWAGISDEEYYNRAVWIKDNIPFCELILEFGANRPWIHVAYNSMSLNASNFKTRVSVNNVYKSGLLCLKNQPGVGGVAFA